MSSHSLHKWCTAVLPNENEQSSDTLREVKKEDLKLRAELGRVEDERDILKMARLIHCQVLPV